MKAYNIQWDTDGDEELAASLPQEIEIPDGLVDPDEIADYITDLTGYCHFGYYLDDGSVEDY